MKKNLFQILATVTVTAFACTSSIASEPSSESTISLDPNLQDYEVVSGISGNLNSVGSDTLNNLMTFWAEGFAKLYPNVKIQIEGKGSSTAPPALIEGTSQLGPMSRKMKIEEIDAFEQKFGYKPRLIAVALDALAVYVNKDNPIEAVTIQQLDSAFSMTRKRDGRDQQRYGILLAAPAHASETFP